MSWAAIEFENVTITYAGEDRPAVRDVTFELEQGELAVLAGIHAHLEPAVAIHDHGCSRALGDERDPEPPGAPQDGPQQGRGVALHVQLVPVRSERSR